jgi:hypothetical protein
VNQDIGIPAITDIGLILDAFRPFVSESTKTLCHSMGNPLKVAEDIIELEEKNEILNSLLKIVTFLGSKYATLHALQQCLEIVNIQKHP